MIQGLLDSDLINMQKFNSWDRYNPEGWPPLHLSINIYQRKTFRSRDSSCQNQVMSAKTANAAG